MLVKLLKYDLKYMLKNMSIFYILALVFAITTRILFEVGNSAIANITAQICVGCMYSMMASIIINVLMRSWVRFRDSIYKDEAYLTHTLPVTKNEIYDSKFIQSLIFFFVSFAVVVSGIFITYFTRERWQLLKETVNSITKDMNFNTTLFVVCILLVFFLEIFNGLQCGYLGMLLGHKMNNSKIGFSVLFGFIVYCVSQGIVLIGVLIAGLFNGSIMDLFKSNVQLSTESFRLLMIMSVIYYIAVIVLMNIVCKKVFNKGVNIE